MTNVHRTDIMQKNVGGNRGVCLLGSADIKTFATKVHFLWNAHATKSVPH